MSITRKSALRAFAALCLTSGILSNSHGESVDPANPYLHTVAADGTLRFELNERIKHPHFWWPRTLLNYHVIATGAAVPADRWSLNDESTGTSVPMQVSDVRSENGRIVSATVSFFSDLPTGGHRSFVLHTTAAGSPAKSPELRPIVTHEGSDIVLDNGSFKVRLPGSQTVPKGGGVPGPVMAVNDGKGWVGESSINSPGKSVRSITSVILDQGPLFARVRITYEFEGGAGYTATIKMPRDYRFIEFTESFTGLVPEDDAAFEFRWTGLPLTHRQGDEPIDRPHVLYYRGEDPHFTGPDHVEDPAAEFYYRLGHCAADSTIFRTSADFSNRDTGRAVGLCVLDGSKWDDGGYPVWAASDTLSVKFRYRNRQLVWRLPLAGKSRQLGIAAYNLNDPENAADLARFSSYDDRKVAIANKGVADGRDLVSLINSRYGGMSLDVVKEWRLDYPQAARRPAKADLPPEGGTSKEMAGPDAYVKALWSDNELVRVEGSWLSPVSLRIMHRWVVPGYHKYRGAMTPEMGGRVDALLLFQSYVAAREEISPIRHMLKGHPNFMSDWKYPLLAGAFLFPDHPMAAEWADQFEKFIELAGVFYVRPEVKPWEAKGGRWTESIAVYNWAFIDPAVRANELGLLYDGRDRMAGPGQALHGGYLSGIVSAPVKLGDGGKPFDFIPGTPLLPENGFQRVHPPQGAHGGRRSVPGCIESFANSFRNFDPMTAEHMLWINRRPAGSPVGFEADVSPADGRALVQGTNPRLKSAKYTGYGIVLRSAVDSPDEISVYLQQVDKGPNYRWGFGNENGGGDIYYYAAGNSYAGHFGEDAGDRRVNDAELTCNTGVYKDSTFRGIGMNDLTEPFYDLGSAQFAEILARPGADAYSWPEYEARSVMLMGHDYIVIHDTVNSMSRVAWNTVKGQDKMPVVMSIRGENSYRTTQTSLEGHGMVTEGMRLEPYKGGGDRMTLVSHREDLKLVPAKKGAASLVSEVDSPQCRDFIYQQRTPFQSDEGGRVFSGRAGVIREFRDGRVELNLFKGGWIGNQALRLAVDNPDLGISAVFRNPAEVSGQFFSRLGGTLTLTFPGGIPEAAALYVNGARSESRVGKDCLVVRLPPGEGRWQLTAGHVVPMAPEITRSVARADGATIIFTPVSSATGYRIESSADGGATWAAVGVSKLAEYTLSGIQAQARLHLRVVALNGETASLPGRDYPVNVTGKPAGPPAGLRLNPGTDEAVVTWGEVLGAKEYVLYRRKVGETDWKEIHRGEERVFRDHVAGIVPSCGDPGLEAQALRQPAKKTVIYEYVVTSVDGTGESGRSQPATSDPASWRNWYPNTPLHYKRRSAYWLPPFVNPDQVPPESYPE